MRRSAPGGRALAALAALLERPLVVRAPLRPLDAIVVLGAPLGPGGALTPVLEERVAAAAALWRAGAGRIVVVTGGGAGPRPEAEAMAEALRARGVPGVLIEPAARTTAENARLVAALLAPRGARSAWLVTQPFHGRRAARLFRAAGLDAHAWHIDDSLEYRDRRRALRWLVREYAAWLKHLAAMPVSWRGSSSREGENADTAALGAPTPGACSDMCSRWRDRVRRAG